MRTLVVGAGATGGYFGGRMAQAGRDVTFLVRGARAEQLSSRGLEIASPLGDTTVHPKLMTAEQLRDAGAFDLVMVATKAYSLPGAIDDFAPAVGPFTLVMPLLNGMRHMTTLQDRFGREKILCGTCQIIGDVDEQGRVVQTGKLGKITCGSAPDSGVSEERIAAVHAELSVPAVDAKHAADGMAAMWEKWWFLSSFGAICVLGGGSLGQVAAAPGGAEMASAVVEEARRVAEKNGHPIAQAALDFQHGRVTSPDTDITSSMYRDMVRGNAVEADAILGDLIASAKDVPVPLMKAAYVRLKLYEASRAR